MNLATFQHNLVIVGCGSIGQGVLPLILRHIDLDPDRITIITADERGRDVAESYGLRFLIKPLTRDNYRRHLSKMLGRGDFLLNLSVDVSSVALIGFCKEVGALYLDTCIEPWVGGYTDSSVSASQRSNYALREQALALRNGPGAPTAVITHGANPGLVSHLVKQALLNIAEDGGINTAKPQNRQDWGELMEKLGVRVVHIAERDTQISPQPKKAGEFVNTWSIDGFVGEGCQPAELGWGSHEKALPLDGATHDFGCGSAIYLRRPGAATKVRTWTPNEGPFHGFLITHSESVSISDYFTLRDGEDLRFRPTTHYAYHPCDDAILSLHELAGKNWTQQDEQRLLMDDIVTGMDELGVLLMGHERGAYWYGSQLTIGEARQLAPHNSATSLQVTATVLAGMIYAMERPNLGIIEPDEMDFERVLEIARPYLGNVVGVYSDWTPLEGRNHLFAEAIDSRDPWQFSNFRVV